MNPVLVLGGELVVVLSDTDELCGVIVHPLAYQQVGHVNSQ